MRKILLLVIGLLSTHITFAQNPSAKMLGFEAFEFSTEKLGNVNYYLSQDSSGIQKPLLVYLDGSGSYPLFQVVEGGIASTVVLDFQRLREDFTILLIGKPGVPFSDVVDFDAYGFPMYDEPEAYTKYLSLDWRVDTADKIIHDLIQKNTIDAKRIVVFGFSEGAQVAPKLAAKNKHITHLMLFGGNGLNQLFDPIISTRMKAVTGEISQTQAQVEIDSLFNMYQDIYDEPLATDKNWWGHTYQRWASFTLTDPSQYLLQLDIPIYMANGSLDENSVLSADYIQLEFIKNKKSNLTYKTYPNCDHQFNELVIENGVFKQAIPRLDEVLRDAFEWLEMK
ncbi:MAG: hypothetical protein AAGA77_26145 [Bacteroidota bacterium]